VVLHLDAEDILDYAARIERIPVPFVIDHMGRVKAKLGLGQAPFQRLLGLLENPLAWIKVCGAECGIRGMSATDSDLKSAGDSEMKSAIPI
jgi:predicted TIM-barrel fold metal-dependent hydrolase